MLEAKQFEKVASTLVNFACMPCLAKGRTLKVFASLQFTREAAEAAAIGAGWLLLHDRWHCPRCVAECPERKR